jgi:serine/threonine-protein kinase HipA
VSERLQVWRGQHRLGELWLANEGHAMGFTYADRADLLPISNSLPVAGSPFSPEEGVAHRWFANLLPEEGAREALVRRLGVADDDFSLLAAIGGDCAGALQLLLPGQQPSMECAIPIAMDMGQLARWAEGRERFALFDAHAGQAARLSLSGAQDKIPVVMLGDTLALPGGNAPSTHLIKFAAKQALILNELYMNRLAAHAGLPVPASRIGRAGKGAYLLVERYDRIRDERGTVLRLHQEDFCQALGLPRRLKYQEDGGPSLGDCTALLRRVTVSPAAGVRQLLRWQIFNVLTGNADGHAKNLSLLQDERGHWSLAPCYDLLCTLVLPYSKHMGFAVGSAYHPQQLQRKHWEELAGNMVLGVPFVFNELKTMIDTLQELLDGDAVHASMLACGMNASEWTKLQDIRKTVKQQCKRLMML